MTYAQIGGFWERLSMGDRAYVIAQARGGVTNRGAIASRAVSGFGSYYND
jgi:hypothetical protein